MLIAAGPLEQVIEDLAAHGIPVEEGPVERTGATGPILSVTSVTPTRTSSRSAPTSSEHFAGGRCHSPSGGALSSRERHHAGRKKIMRTSSPGRPGRWDVPGSRAGRGGARGHRHHEDARQGRAAARGGRRAGGLDGLDREAVIAAVLAAAPEVIVHEMTALAGMRSLRNPDKHRGHEPAADPGHRQPAGGRGAGGTRRVVARATRAPGRQAFRRPAEDRRDPPDWRPIRSLVQTPAAMRHVEEAVPSEVPEGIVLRYDASTARAPRMCCWRCCGSGRCRWSAAGRGCGRLSRSPTLPAATLAAVDRGAPGVYNVVDDDPAPVAEWLPYLARVAGAKPPLRVPPGRPAAGRGVRGGSDDHLARLLEREGQEELAGSRGTRAGGRDSVPGSADETAAYRPLSAPSG